MNKNYITIKDIEDWISNDEGLYDWWRQSRLSKRQFIKDNKEQLKNCIQKVLDGRRPAHYLKYGDSSNL